MELVNANTAVINGATVAVVEKPKYKRGVPKVEVKTATIGDKVQVYENVDYTEATGECTIKVQPTAENIELLEDWRWAGQTAGALWHRLRLYQKHPEQYPLPERQR